MANELKDWDQWQAYAMAGKNHDNNVGNTFVRAKTRAIAERIATEVLSRRAGTKRIVVRVRPYYPWDDPNMKDHCKVTFDTPQQQSLTL